MSRIIPGANATAARWSPQPVGTTGARSVSMVTARQLEQVQRDAYREGFAQGRADAFAGTSQQMRALLDTLAHPLEAVGADLVAEIAALVIACARQLIRRELRTSPGEVIAVVREALDVLPVAARRITVHLHPDDAQLVRDALGSGAGERRWSIVDDSSLTRGGCRVVSGSSRVDATVEARIAAVAARLLGDERAAGDH
jgi:flagellar assembly protein FliH